MESQALSVGQLTEYIQSTLESDDRLQNVWVMGEVSSSNPHRSGIFFTLQDSENQSQISCVVWQGLVAKLQEIPARGVKVLVLGSIRLYPQRGQYQLTAWQVLPLGEGLQALQYRQLRARLEAEGLFDLSRKRSLPVHPQTIAVVTSPQAAAWGDIQKTLKQRYPGLKVLLSPATVQGEQAPDSIVRAIARVERDGRAEVLVLARGGGAVEELACFNDEKVARAVADCSIPVVTGIGHQRDESLADLAADVCAHTPTAAAELVVPELATLIAECRQQQTELSEAVQFHLERSQTHLANLKARYNRLPIEQQLQQQRQRVKQQQNRLTQAVNWRFKALEQHQTMLQAKLTALDPQRVLERGYAVVKLESGAIANSVEQVAIGQYLEITLAQGRIQVQVTDLSFN
ncbi:exodeoxyribonuclease VII large subunit [Merismopedia glauca]|uniref:Exodeoxyribonuclease 7 large subunit n=1 Tax=Merismopedia glauca CCAP 1448/3 TaxID=1296344 RepID=A0A2T1C830_9CYAN|nr:exodeoxyribonuclease VII large subunit [Merismopedia glauca]PSB04384.1 exodeoxyribonuclease VII large subunit [Merismopedia glauca CCAP 1448/3]